MRSNVARRQPETKPASSPAARPYRIEEQVGYLLRRAHQRASSIFQVSIGDPNITPTQYSSMVKLHEYTELSQNHLGRLVGMDKATMQGVVRRLKERHLVDSRPASRRRAAHAAQPDQRRPSPDHQAAGQRARGVARDSEAAQQPGAAPAPRASFQDHLSHRSADLQVRSCSCEDEDADLEVRAPFDSSRASWHRTYTNDMGVYLRPRRLEEALSALARPRPPHACWPAAPTSIRRGSAGRSTRTCSTSAASTLCAASRRGPTGWRLGAHHDLERACSRPTCRRCSTA